MNNCGWRTARVHNGEYWADLSTGMTPEAIYQNHFGSFDLQIEFALKLDPSNTGHWQFAAKDAVGITCFGGSSAFVDATHAATRIVLGE